jgi:putative cardiolipin synthase
MNRLNHRMHNKLMIADNFAAIVGGRNIGNEYFGIGLDMNFRDMDLLAIGPIARNISESFDLYWNSRWSYPPEVLAYLRPEEKSLLRLKKKIQNTINKNKELLAAFGTEPQDWSHLISQLSEHLTWAKARVLYDQPTTAEGIQPVQMAREIGRFTKKTQRELFIISPYLIPTDQEIQTFRELVGRGVLIRILTNSLASNDVVIANTGYKRYR